MNLKLSAFIPCAALIVAFVACRPVPPAAPGAGGSKSRQLKLAIAAYTNLVDKYPDSEFAPQAQGRLTVLKASSAGGPAPQR